MFEIMAGLLSALALATPNDLPWAGAGQMRVLVRVDSARPAQGAAKPTSAARVDERPAEVRINVAELLQARGIEQQVIDPSSIEVIRHDAQNGAPLRSGKFAFGRHELEIPSRWYDAAIPYEYPECEANLATSGGKLPRFLRERTGYFYECVGDGRDGRLAFVHRDDGQPAWYAVYFDLLPAGKLPDKQPPRGFVGDGLQRCEPKGHGTTGLIHSRLDLADLSGDGLPDMIVGCGRGSIVWYPNVGSAADWRFVNSRLLATSDGVPIDIGYGSAPHALDFDADGKLDLLVGGERNRVVWYRNVGPAAQQAWEYQGLVEVEGRPLELPVTPVPEGPEVFKLDYYPVLASPDWDDDGDQDLLAGGYITGRIYYYENTAGRGAPLRLRFAGEIQADGAPLDVSWCAAPTVGDVDGDGDLDLFSGCMPMTSGGGDGVSRERFLLYFENIGTRAEPRLHARSLPRDGEFPRGALATPRLADFNGDGLLDIVASSGERIFFFRNAGTRAEPRFAAHSEAMPGVWSNAPLAGTQFFDYDGDGLADGIDGPRVYRNTGRGSPGVFASPQSLLKPGQRIDHLSGIGDDWTFQRLYDLDRDGALDLMDADHAGHLWWHRNNGTTAECDFVTTGVQLALADGAPLIIGSARTGFDALQGARATYTVGDFDGDERADIVSTDTFGEVMYFQQAGNRDRATPVFDPGRRIAKLRIRGVPTACDWDGDGQLDVVAGSRAADVVLIRGYRGAEGKAAFEEPRPIGLPDAPDGAGAPLVVTDFNGDGDLDIILHTAYAYTCFFERSFIDGGYARGEVVALEIKPR